MIADRQAALVVLADVRAFDPHRPRQPSNQHFGSFAIHPAISLYALRFQDFTQSLKAFAFDVTLHFMPYSGNG